MYPVVTVIALAGLVVVAHQAPAAATAVESVFQSMRPASRWQRQSPEHHLDGYIFPPVGIAEEQPGLHDGVSYHNRTMAQSPRTSRHPRAQEVGHL